MSSPTFIFKGVDGSECERFVQAIRQHAFTKGRSRDREWIADFVATCFIGSALRWYETLSSEVQSDWNLLRNAMLSQYSEGSVMEIDSDGFTSLSDGPIQAVDMTLANHHGPTITSNIRTGRIRVESSPRVLRGYISRQTLSNGTHMITKERGQALYVRFVPSNGPCDLSLVNSSTGLELLGVSFDGHPKFVSSYLKPDCSELGILAGLVRSTSPPKFGSSGDKTITSQSTVWTIDGKFMYVHWMDDEGTTHRLDTIGSMTNHGLYFYKASAQSHYVSFEFEEI